MDYVGSFFILAVSNYLASDEPIWRGYALVGYLMLFKFVQAVCNTQYRFQMLTFSLHLKAALSTQIYEKSLKATTRTSKASGESSEKASYAQITNLMQVDLERIATGIPYSLRAGVWPFQISFGIYMMFKTLGSIGSFAALGAMLVLFLINGVTSKKIGQFMKLIMEKKDGRMKYCVELLTNMKVLKMYNWEQKIVDRVTKAREEEIRVTRSAANWFNFIVFLNWGTRNYMIVAIVAAMSVSGEALTPGNIFAGITVLAILNMSIRFLPDIINNFIQLLISMNRIEEYLRAPEAQEYNDREMGKAREGVAVELKEASFSWSAAERNAAGELPELRLALQDVNITIPQGEFVAVVGRVGAGKSSLLQGLIGNMNFIKRSPDSHMFMNGSVSFVSQEAWIQNMTIKDNILFGNPLVEKRYQEVLDICELRSDLQILPGGDLTEIGEKGINLSGGQKARVAIARAVYANTDIILLDDPLSALDAHVGKNIYSRCLSQYCTGKTRILATHGQHYLPNVDRIIVIHEGKVVEVGTYSELLASNGYFKNEFLVAAQEEESHPNADTTSVKPEAKSQSSESKIIEIEDKAVGSVSSRVYKDYYHYMGGCTTVLAILVSMLCWQGLRMYADIYLSEWSEQSPKEQEEKMLINNLTYAIASFALNLFVLVRLRFTTNYGLQAAQTIFTKMIKSLADAPINKYFDVTPNGRILNRLSKDQGQIDGMLMMMLGGFIGQAFTVVLIVSMCAYAIPYMLLVVPLLIYLSIVVQKLYLASSRELTRIESISRSPIIQLFSETISGAPIIRAFGYQSRFTDRNLTCLNENTRVGFYLAGVNGWLTVALELISNLALTCCAIAIISLKGNIDVGLAVMAMSYALSLPENFYWLVFLSSSMENAMVSVERTVALTKIISEAPRKRQKDEMLQVKSWPERGEIDIQNFSLKYREDTELVLKGINAHIQPHENVGIVGRTGSGKSSLCLALFRIVEGYSGRILIDGVDISEVGLDLLRQRMSVIPQDPTLFRGKLRDNFDPFNTISDELLGKTLTELEMFPGKPIPEVLQMDAQENGENFSVGERQLICIVRAILRNTRIMFLDEATASIDYRTDQLIQTTIREKFRSCTVLTIAHRINTIMDYDRVLVMDKGTVAEFDSPAELKAQGGLFASLVQESRL
jgi:ABC-type multidrug transport system fused ATPase/permease subunit